MQLKNAKRLEIGCSTKCISQFLEILDFDPPKFKKLIFWEKVRTKSKFSKIFEKPEYM
jgi:hypothetical protein